MLWRLSAPRDCPMSSSDKLEPPSPARQPSRKTTARRRARDTAPPLPDRPDRGEPWDRESAEALTRIYDSVTEEMARLGPGQRSHPRPRGEDLPAQGEERDPDWLEARLVAIAGRLEQSLAAINPEKSIDAFNTRLDRLEQRFDAALKDVALRSDVAGLGQISAQAHELAAQFDQARGQLARLDTIESQLRDLAQKFDEQLQPHASADGAQLEAAIDAAAKRAAAAIAAAVPAATDQKLPRIDILEDLLQEQIDERRRSEEITSSVLSAIENALARISDRLDAIDRQANAPVAAGDRQGPPPDILHAESDALTEAYEKGARALGQKMGFALDAADYAAPGSPRVFRQPPEQPIDEQSEAASAPEIGAVVPAEETVTREAFRTSALRAKLKAQAANSREAVQGEAGAAMPAARASATSPAARRSTRPALFLAGVLLFGAGYLAVDRLLDRSMPAPAPQAAPASETGAALPPGNAAAAASTFSSGSPAPAKAESAPIQESGEPMPVPVPAPTAPRRRHVPETVTEDLGMAEPPASGSFARMRALGNAVTGWFRATPAALKTDGEMGRSGVKDDALGGDGMPPGVKAEPPATIGTAALRKAAAAGDPAAQFEVASCYADGSGVAQDWKAAHAWYQRAAMRGFAPAQFRLSLVLERGLGVAPDAGRAKVWYRRAAEQGHVKAMHNLAVLSLGSDLARADYVEAARWFRQAAEHGLADSQFNMAVLSETGRGMPKDLAAAYKWYALAASAGDKEAGRRLDAVKERLAAADLSAVVSTVASWKPQPLEPVANGLQSRPLGE
jgi:localization factor PodJL